MARQTKRWPVWRITAVTAGCAVGAGVLLWLSAFADRLTTPPGAEPVQPSSVMSLPSLIMALGMGLAVASIVGVIWIVARIRESRIPPWERKAKKRRRRRRR